MNTEPPTWPNHPHPFPLARWSSVLAAGLALLAVLLTLAGPGLTVDEPLDVSPGRQYLKLLTHSGARFWSAEVINATYANNCEHPPLGRWLLGLCSVFFEPIEAQLRGPDPTSLYVRSGRVAPAIAFALLVFLVSRWTGTIAGPVASLAAGSSLLFMPRVFAHAHLAVLDTFVALTWTAAFLALVNLCEYPSSRKAAGATVLVALALLTKIHGWLLIPAILLWLLVRRPGWRPLPYLAISFLAAVVLFVAGWPWLWNDPFARLAAFFQTGLNRLPIKVLYFGNIYLDKDIPWHYPWFYTAVTVPVGVLLMAVVGLVGAWRGIGGDPRPRALLVVILFWLMLFSGRVPVYDGERLYLVVFPMIAILAGLGFASVWQRLGVTKYRVLLAGFLLLQGYGLVSYHPFQLSYFNGLIGGLQGAERLGLELTYWGDAVDDRLLARLEELASPGAKVARVPTLAPGQGLSTTTRPLFRKEVFIQDQEQRAEAEWLVIDRRTAYWPEDLAKFVSDHEAVFLRTTHGVWLSGIWKRVQGKSRE